jgi:hypothetical protein
VAAAPGQALNALLLGESEARHLGVDVERLKRELVFCTALGVGAAVAAAGLIGSSAWWCRTWYVCWRGRITVCCCRRRCWPVAPCCCSPT